MSETRVLIAENDPTIAEAITELIESDPTLAVVGCASDANEAVDLAWETTPRVAVVDVVMPGGGGGHATRELKKLSDPPHVLAISATADRTSVVEMLTAGALGYLVKGGPADELLAAIQRAARSQSTLSSEASAALIEHLLGTVGELHGEDEEGRAEEVRGEVRALIDDRRLKPVFQPIVELGSRSVVGHEALMRFPPSARTPLVWFADALLAGVGPDLELAAMDASIGAVEAAGLDSPGGFLSLNVSPATLESRAFIDWLEVAKPSKLVLEITEHAAVEDYAQLARTLGRLRERGARVAVDDAGAGYASLRHILRIGPEFIKLDISLTRGIDRSRAGTAMASALLSFAEKTGASVIAEGVETEAELETLVALGAPLGQGFLFGRPAPLSGDGGPPAGPVSAAGAQQ